MTSKALSSIEAFDIHEKDILLYSPIDLSFDTTASGEDKYWCEEFPMKDYEYANKWLNGEIEYGDYLNEIKDSNMEL